MELEPLVMYSLVWKKSLLEIIMSKIRLHIVDY